MLIEPAALPSAAAPCRPAAADPAVLAHLGPFEVRLAATEAERGEALALRYKVFHAELGAGPSSMDHVTRLETDRFDAHCDHIVVRDRRRGRLAGTYRALRAPVPGLGFYADAEFSAQALRARHPGTVFCEVGRSCVHPAYRTTRALEALWRGLWAYACRYGIDAYFGAASFPGTDPLAHALPLAWLFRHVAAPPDWTVEAHGPDRVTLDDLPAGPLDRRAAYRAMPPLIRGYLRVNAHFGRSAYVDRQFGTIDVMVVARLSAAPPAWRRHFETVTGERLEKPHG